MAGLTRTVAVVDITPDELADVFADMWAEEQAAFLNAVHVKAKDWPNSGWCGQACEIAKQLDRGGREVVAALYDHMTTLGEPA